MSKFIRSFIPANRNYWTEVEVYHGTEMRRVDIVIEDENEAYTLVEVKSEPNEVDKAIGQILEYKVLFGERYGVSKGKISVGIVCPSFHPFHKEICSEVGIRLWQVQP
jgi:hypothetical protein